MGDLKLPAIDYGALSPMLILFGAACLGVLIEATVPKRLRHTVQLTLALVAIAVAFVAVIVFNTVRFPDPTPSTAQESQ